MTMAPAAKFALLLAYLAVAGCASTGSMTQDPGSMGPAERQIIVAVHDEGAGLQARAGSISRPYGHGMQYRGTLQARRQLARLASRHELQAVTSWPIAMLDLYCVVFEIPEGRSRDELLGKIAAEPGVALVQRMQLFSTLAQEQSHAPAGGAAGIAGREIRHAHQWATGRGVKVALIDTGLDSGHPALKGRVLGEQDFVGSQALAAADEPHGLAVAGVIAARADLEPGMVGVAPGAGLLALRACWHTDPVNAVCNSLTLARAIAAAVDQGANVINLSLTGPPDALLERLLKRAMARNLVVIGALPEGGGQGNEPPAMSRFPTSVPGVIAVQTAEYPGALAPGAVPAPGQGILTLRPGGGYGLANGSSLAAAHVSGVVALLLERRAQLGTDQVRALLGEHIRPLALDGRGTVQLVHACRAVASLVDGQCPPVAERTAEAGPRAEPPSASPAGD
jgi:hypothetical protein